jgi:ketosteroid isomerase-like protein
MSISDVIIGQGKLAGKGVYAARDFKEGELVVPYNLRALTQAEFDALPDGEWEWTHSFWGRIYLFPEPARYVNSATDPSTYPDLERRGDYALRDIRKGEAITIDDRIELRHELETFLEAYERAVNSRNFSNVAPLIADDASFWLADGNFKGKEAVRKAFEDIWKRIQEETYTPSDVQWIAASYRVASCTYALQSDDAASGEYQVCRGKGTSVLARLNGSWRIVHEHLS